MNVLFFIDNNNEYSYNTYALCYALLLNAFKENDIHVLTINTYEKDDYYFAKDKNVLYLPNHKLNNLLFQVANINAAFKIIGSFKPDIIHILSDSKLFHLANFISKKYDVPMVKTVATNKIKDNNEIDEYIVHSLKMKDEIRKKLMNRYINIVPLGIDIDDFDDNPLDKIKIKAKRNELRINTTSTIYLTNSDINAKTIIEGYKNFIIAHPELDTVLIVINNDKSTIELMDLVKDYHIESYVRFTSKLTHEERIIFYKLSTYYIGADLSSDSIIHYLYALNSNLITFAHYDTSLFSLIKKDECGFYYKDADSLSSELYRVYNLEDKKKSEIINNANSSVINLTSSNYYKGILKVYERAKKARW